ncbi:laccase precursor [Flagelloscypha sp. PMI_526]|nr:laccase precursor [Flagelloscypha sp. PMI_526]
MLATILSSTSVALSLAHLAQAALGPVSDLHIVNQVVSPDGFTRQYVSNSSIIAGSSFPGDAITANKGADFAVNVHNELTDATMLRQTSIHWHGLYMSRETSWADGVPGVTQCPIAQNHSFTYKFNPGKQTGTYWYHSHLGTQYCDGLRGPLIIYDDQDPHKSEYDIDDETTIISLAEWYHQVAPQVTLPAVAEATLFNGKGRYPSGPKSDLFVLNVKANKRYRLRVISMSCEPLFDFYIEGHQLTVLEVDGEDTEPHTVDKVRIFAGQRYSLVLNTNQPADNYWMRAMPNMGTSKDLTDGGLNSAILRYEGAPNQEPSNTGKLDAPKTPLVETDLHPLAKVPVPGKPTPGGADVNVDVHLALDLTGPTGPRFTVNNISYSPPTVPVLLQILTGTKDARQLFPQGLVYDVKKGDSVEVRIFGGTEGGPHPFHLHGHSFWVVKSPGNLTYNYQNPVYRDVVGVGNSTAEEDITVIRFLADNAGPYILHCHADWHMDIGMAMVFAENVNDTSTIIPPDEWKDLCPIYGNLTEADLAVQKPASANATGQAASANAASTQVSLTWTSAVALAAAGLAFTAL